MDYPSGHFSNDFSSMIFNSIYINAVKILTGYCSCLSNVLNASIPRLFNIYEVSSLVLIFGIVSLSFVKLETQEGFVPGLIF